MGKSCSKNLRFEPAKTSIETINLKLIKFGSKILGFEPLKNYQTFNVVTQIFADHFADTQSC